MSKPGKINEVFETKYGETKYKNGWKVINADYYNEEWGIGELLGRKCADGTWEYVTVDWRYHNPSFGWYLKANKQEEL
jgi:hypothetical protein